MGLFLLFLIASLPNHHPQAPIVCKQYYPNTNHVLPAGVRFNYTPAQKVLNNLRCYCETVKPLERRCVQSRFPLDACQERTAQWAEQNLANVPDPQNVIAPAPVRQNAIINIQPTP